MFSGDPLELPEEAACEEQTRGVLQEPLPDLPGVRRKPAETRAVRLSESGRTGERAGQRRARTRARAHTHTHTQSERETHTHTLTHSHTHTHTPKNTLNHTHTHTQLRPRSFFLLLTLWSQIKDKSFADLKMKL